MVKRRGPKPALISSRRSGITGNPSHCARPGPMPGPMSRCSRLPRKTSTPSSRLPCSARLPWGPGRHACRQASPAVVSRCGTNSPRRCRPMSSTALRAACRTTRGSCWPSPNASTCFKQVRQFLRKHRLPGIHQRISARNPAVARRRITYVDTSWPVPRLNRASLLPPGEGQDEGIRNQAVEHGRTGSLLSRQ